MDPRRNTDVGGFCRLFIVRTKRIHPSESRYKYVSASPSTAASPTASHPATKTERFRTCTHRMSTWQPVYDTQQPVCDNQHLEESGSSVATNTLPTGHSGNIVPMIYKYHVNGVPVTVDYMIPEDDPTASLIWVRMYKAGEVPERRGRI